MKILKNKRILIASSLATSKQKDFLLEVSKMDNKDLQEKFQVDFEKGILTENLETLEETYGKNTITKVKKEPIIIKLLKSFASPFILILLFIAIISAIINYFDSGADEHATWFITPIIILAMILLSGLISFSQNLKSERSMNSLKNMTENNSLVLRDGVKQDILNEHLTIGDIVYLSSGDMIPADLRIIQSKELFLVQATLTGEQDAIEKKPTTAELKDENDLFNLENMVFQGTTVVSGSGVGVVCSIGNNTIFGSLSKKVSEKKGKTSFEIGINSIARLLLIFVSVMVPLILVFRGFGLQISGNGVSIGNYNDLTQWTQAFVFAISVAIGMMPTLLPMQIASNLAKGAINMSKKQVIVKDINSIQNFGAMNILCTDKTGTLTENKSKVASYFSAWNEEDEKILRLTFLNSYYQTGIKSSIDTSVLDYVNSNQTNFQKTISGMTKLDEIPFDFERKRLSVLLKDGDGNIFMITKGALNNMLSILKYIKTKNGVRQIIQDDIRTIQHNIEKEADKGRRAIIIATKNLDKTEIGVADENELTYNGYISFEDTPKESVTSALKSLKEYGVEVKVLTGDLKNNAVNICQQVGFENIKVISGTELNKLNQEDYHKAVKENNIFVKLTPEDKFNIVKALRENKNVVGFMGDGINDGPALHEADIGISFKDATDIAKETADIIMLNNNLNVLAEGILEGRKSYLNMIKYIKIQTSSNFGNMISQIIGSLFIPFLPMRALQIILLGLISDFSSSFIPFDKVDKKDLMQPIKFSTKSIRNFMFTFGPVSSIVDILAFITLLLYICPMQAGGVLNSLDTEGKLLFIALFQTGFFLESLITQNFVFLTLRTDRIPFIKSRPSVIFSLSVVVAILIGFFVCYVPVVSHIFSFGDLSIIFIAILAGMLALYITLTQAIKPLYKKFNLNYL